MFVYNAKSGLFNKMTDFAHKLLSPETYECNLCKITYSDFGMRKEWQRYLSTLERPVEFLYKDELHEKHSIDDISLPAIFIKTGQHLELAADATSINACRTLADLQKLVNHILQSHMK